MLAPPEYRNAGTMMLISGVLNLLISLGLIGGLIWIAVGCFWILTLAVGIFEIVIGLAMASGERRDNAKLVSIAGLVAAILCGNLISLVLEIIVLTRFGSPAVSAWLGGWTEEQSDDGFEL
jgi:hypothetical protein